VDDADDEFCLHEPTGLIYIPSRHLGALVRIFIFKVQRGGETISAVRRQRVIKNHQASGEERRARESIRKGSKEGRKEGRLIMLLPSYLPNILKA
jgi:hypothetical protein